MNRSIEQGFFLDADMFSHLQRTFLVVNMVPMPWLLTYLAERLEDVLHIVEAGRCAQIEASNIRRLYIAKVNHSSTVTR